MIQLPLSNWTSNSSSIIAQAERFSPAVLLANNPDQSLLHGLEKQRAVIVSSINTSAVGGLSWNTGPETSIYMTRPFSRGSVTINSTSIFTAPLIDYGAIMDPTDLEILYALYMKNRELMSTPNLAVLGPVETAPAPGFTDAELIKEKLKKALAPSNAHQCCTAAMMSKEDGGVVDPQNRVYGTHRLSIVDASVWPLIVGGGPQASVYAGAEKVCPDKCMMRVRFTKSTNRLQILSKLGMVCCSICSWLVQGQTGRIPGNCIELPGYLSARAYLSNYSSNSFLIR
jgi:choline dehydrogenase